MLEMYKTFFSINSEATYWTSQRATSQTAVFPLRPKQLPKAAILRLSALYLSALLDQARQYNI